MKTYPLFAALVLTTVCLVFAGCGGGRAETVTEGILFSVEYQLENGRTGGFTRLNDSRAVPGHNGSWNVDAYGRLTRDYLIITRPQRPDLGPQIIPAHRLVAIQFGTGGVGKVDESQPTPGKS